MDVTTTSHGEASDDLEDAMDDDVEDTAEPVPEAAGGEDCGTGGASHTGVSVQFHPLRPRKEQSASASEHPPATRRPSPQFTTVVVRWGQTCLQNLLGRRLGNPLCVYVCSRVC